MHVGAKKVHKTKKLLSFQTFFYLYFKNCFLNVCSSVVSVRRSILVLLVHHYLLELLRRELIQALQLAQALSVTLVEAEEICSAVLQQVHDQTQAGGPGVSH